MATKKNKSESTGGGGGSGAWIRQEYLGRTEQVVGVNPDMLNDLLGEEIEGLAMLGIGEFFLAGSIWLGIEKLTDQAEFAMTATLWACLFALLFGLGFCAAGLSMAWRRRKKIERVMKNTYVIGVSSPISATGPSFRS